MPVQNGHKAPMTSSNFSNIYVVTPAERPQSTFKVAIVKEKESVADTSTSRAAPSSTSTAPGATLPASAVAVAAAARRAREERDMREELLPSAAVRSSQEAAVRRLATAAGWDQMNQWLHAAEKEEKWPQLQSLLEQCAEVAVKADLLKRNDTPKLIRRLSQRCPHKGVRKLAAEVVELWMQDLKQAAKDPAPQTASESGGGGRRASSDSGGAPSQSTAAADSLNSSGATGSPPVSESTSLFEKLQPAAPARRGGETAMRGAPRAPTAKTRPTKFRSTGLEDEDLSDTPPPPPKRPRGSPAAASKGGQKKASVSPSAGEKYGAPIVVESLDLNPALPPPIPPVAPMASPKAKLAPPPPPKPVKVIESNMFMDALVTASSKPAVVRRKKVVPRPPDVATKGPRRPSTEGSPTLAQSPTAAAYAAGAHPSSYSPPANSRGTNGGTAKKRVRFADANGQSLTIVHEFALDMAERANVTVMGGAFGSGAAATDMKHAEMQRERMFLDEARKKRHVVLPVESQMETYLKWRLQKLGNIQPNVDVKSEEKLVQAERQKHVQPMNFMDRFPDFPTEPDFSERSAVKEEPAIIPTEEVTAEPPTAASTGSAQTTAVVASAAAANPAALPSISLPPELAQLMSNLSQKGIIAGQQAPPTTATTLPVPSSVAPAVGAPSVPMPPMMFPPQGFPPFPLPGMGNMPLAPPGMPFNPAAAAAAAAAAAVAGMRPPLTQAPSMHQRLPPNAPPINSSAQPPIQQPPGMLQVRNLRFATPTEAMPPYLRPCPYFAQNRCTFGDKCKFAHDRGSAGGGEVVGAPPPQPQPTVGGGGDAPPSGAFEEPPFRRPADRDYRNRPPPAPAAPFDARQPAGADFPPRDRDYRSPQYRGGGGGRRSPVGGFRRGRAPVNERPALRRERYDEERRQRRRGRSPSKSKSRSPRSRSKSSSRSRSRSPDVKRPPPAEVKDVADTANHTLAEPPAQTEAAS